MSSLHYFRNCRPGADVWLLAAKRLHLHMGVYFISVLLALARALPESQLLALVCTNSKQLHSLVGLAFGRCTCLVITPTLNTNTCTYMYMYIRILWASAALVGEIR